MPTVLRTSQAHLDLVEIALRIVGENPVAADRWLDLIDAKCQLLARMPELGRKRPDLAPELRGLPVGNSVGMTAALTNRQATPGLKAAGLCPAFHANRRNSSGVMPASRAMLPIV
jgi:toxin ParE1/3/4